MHEIFPNDEFSPTPQMTDKDRLPDPSSDFNQKIVETPRPPAIPPSVPTETPHPTAIPNNFDHMPSVTPTLPILPISQNLQPTPQMTEGDARNAPTYGHSIGGAQTPQNILEEMRLPLTPIPGSEIYDPIGVKLSQYIRSSDGAPFTYLSKMRFRGRPSLDQLEPSLPGMPELYKTFRDYRKTTEPIYPLGYRFIKSWQN
ncbi:hypothetical protein HYT74_03505 [Candidatus Daviesbacteria bacterium]|nr:hypothetical protein [Candidatus Daviesbacteria bacterium]